MRASVLHTRALPIKLHSPFRIVREKVAGFPGKDKRRGGVGQVSAASATTNSVLIPPHILPEKIAHQEPTQNEDTSFMSSQIPENSMPALDQLVSASVQKAVAFSENQSGKT